jgi:hypothetical protein
MHGRLSIGFMFTATLFRLAPWTTVLCVELRVAAAAGGRMRRRPAAAVAFL